MEFEWDENKRLSNLAKHGLDFIDVGTVFKGEILVAPARSTVEERSLAVGLLAGRHVTVIFTLRDEVFRIISFRRAPTDEKARYEKIYGGRTG